MGLGLVERPGEGVHVVADGPELRLSAAMGLLNVATAEVVASIAEALADGGWQGDGITTAEQWVALRCGVSGAPSPRLVALARTLGQLPEASACFAEGALCDEQVALVCACVDPSHDAESPTPRSPNWPGAAPSASCVGERLDPKWITWS